MCVSICVQYIICGKVLEIEYVKCDFTLGILVSFQRKRWEQGGGNGFEVLFPRFTEISVRTVSVAGTGEVAETDTGMGTSTAGLVVATAVVITVVVVEIAAAAAEQSAVADAVNCPIHNCTDSHILCSSQQGSPRPQESLVAVTNHKHRAWNEAFHPSLRSHNQSYL